MNGINDRINDRAATQAESEQLRQMALTQDTQAQAYQRTRQAHKTVRQGDKWVRVPVEAPGGSSSWRTVQQEDGRWVRVPV
mgnify:CR=1 FL=1